MNLRRVRIIENDLLGIHDHLVLPFGNLAVQATDLFFPLVVEMSLFGIEYMIIAKQEPLAGFHGLFILLCRFAPEDDDSGPFSPAHLSAILADLLKGAVNLARIMIGREDQPVDSTVKVAVQTHRGRNTPELLPASGSFKVGDDLFGNGSKDF